MTTFNTILIKYSTVTAAPTSLLKGELAYSEASGKLFIGNDAGQVVYIGGEDLVNRVGGLESLATQLQDLINTNHTTVMDAVGVVQGRLDDLEAFRATAEGQISSIETDLGTVDQRIADAKADVEGQITAAADLAASNLAAEVATLVAQSDIDRQETADNLAGAVSALEGQITDAANTAASDLVAATDAQAAVNAALNDQVNQVAQDLAEFEGETADALAVLQSQIDQTTTGPIVALEAKDIELKVQIDSLDTRVGEVRSLLNDGSPTFGSVTVTGDLVVQGQTVTVDSEVTTIKDPVITLAQGVAVADGLGRGIDYKYFNGGVQKTGFFGVDTLDNKFKFIPDASVSGNLFSGQQGVIKADLDGKLSTARTIAIGGEAQGSVAFDGSSDVTLTVNVVAEADAAADSVVRRTAAGGIKAVDVEVAGNVTGAGNTISGFIINGGEF
jgi:hypothetical protein